jgi:hypothetical protein
VREKLEPIAFWGVAAVAAGLVVLLGAVLSGRLVSEPTGAGPTLSVAAETTLSRDPAPAPKTTAASDPQPSPAAPAGMTVVLRAARGDSWVEARAGGSDGRLLYFQLLPAGKKARLSARRVWLLLGAAHNLDVTVNGTRRALGTGVVTVLLR